MKNITTMMMLLLVTVLLAAPAAAVTFDSGTTCTSASDPGGHDKCLGVFNPVVDTYVTLPADGILDYSTYTIPPGINVSFTKNAANTPVTIRVFGDVSLQGNIYVTPTLAPTNSGTWGDGNLGDDGQPGIGGPGGSDGGYGGYAALFGGAAWQVGGAGKGPGGGQPGANYNSGYSIGGGGGGFSTVGASSWNNQGPGGLAYGQASLLPLVGGSGGGGGLAGATYSGAGGGGGGGAILIAAGTAAAPATISVGSNGFIVADGGVGGFSAGSGCGGEGGGGSGGAIRLVANTLAHPGAYSLYARGGGGGGGCWSGGGGGAHGIIRLEANILTGWVTGNSIPPYSFGLPGHAAVPNSPTLTIVSVTANATTVPVPATPTGNADVSFPTGTTTATVALAATNIPPGSVADVHVIPSSGAARTKVLSSAFTGGLTASATVTLSPGNNVLQAAVTYTVTEVIAMNLPMFDNGERVAKIRVEGGMDGQSKVTYITASGKEYPAAKAKA